MIRQPSPPKVPLGANCRDQHWRVAAVCLVLAAITFAVFGQTARFAFVNYDDKSYIYDNPMVQKGLTLQGAVWALTYGKIGHWHPLTWLTHMADCQVYGLRAGGHHLTNVALHAMAAVLLFLALKEMTGSLWRCAFVAAVFAIHPLRVESVAWIAERKDVLSGVFFMLTLWAYARYARRPSRGRYVAVAVWFGLGLLSKNTLVTLPLVLLLLDWWPLQRLRLDAVKEKIPLFLLSVGSCVATALVPEKVLDIERIPFLDRVGNAVVSYVIYLRQMVYPAGLAIPYLNAPDGPPFWKIAPAFVLLAVISISALAWRNKRPYLLVGWLWYLGMLVPMIGFIQISYYAHADRYTYLPGIGLALAVTWAVADWSAGWKHRPAVLGGLMAVVIGALMACAWRQTTHWKNSEALWTHTIDCTTGNDVAHYNLGLAFEHKGMMDDAIIQYQKASEINANNTEARSNLGKVLGQKGKIDEAIVCFQEALKINPNFPEAHYNLGNAYLLKGNAGEAIAQFQLALQIKPDYAAAENNLGNILRQTGRVDEAIPHLQSALAIKPDFAEAHNNLGIALRQKGKLDEAISHYREALKIKPDFAQAHYDLGNALLQNGNPREAIAQFQETLQLEPANPGAQINLAWLLATSPDAPLRNGNRAVELARQANELTGGNNPIILHTLAAALAEAGRFAEAIETAQRCLHLAVEKSNTNLAGQLRLEMKLYQAGSPYHSPEPSR